MGREDDEEGDILYAQRSVPEIELLGFIAYLNQYILTISSAARAMAPKSLVISGTGDATSVISVFGTPSGNKNCRGRAPLLPLPNSLACHESSCYYEHSSFPPPPSCWQTGETP